VPNDEVAGRTVRKQACGAGNASATAFRSVEVEEYPSSARATLRRCEV
jgi:hypothetical protein